MNAFPKHIFKKDVPTKNIPWAASLKQVSLPQNVFREILKGIAGPVFCPFHKVEETVGHFFEPQVLLDAGSTTFVVLRGMKGTGKVRTRTERAQIFHNSLLNKGYRCFRRYLIGGGFLERM